MKNSRKIYAFRHSFVSDWPVSALDDLYASLSPSRKAHVDAMALDSDRARTLVGEGLARQLLREEFWLTSPVLHRADNGRPYVADEPVFISIAHCDDLVVCAASREPVGIDVERPRPIQPEMVEWVCTPKEAAYVKEDAARFFEVWTGKEAWFKKQGTGITDFKAVNILPLPRQIFHIEDYLIQIL